MAYRVNPRPKYGNKKVCIDNQTFDSVHEYQRWCELRLMERGGVISDLRRQEPFELIPTLKDDQGKTYKKVVYWADFVYIKDGKRIVEDAKSAATADDKVYIIKKKLMLERYGITIHEVFNDPAVQFKKVR